MAKGKRLIDANELKRRIIAFATGCHSIMLSVDSVVMMINQSDTVDAVEVVHGQWSEINKRRDVEGGAECDKFNREVQHASGNNSAPFDFLSAYIHMTKPKDNGECEIPCSECPLSWKNNGSEQMLTCAMFIRRYPERAVELLQKWEEKNKE